ncbi:MAG: T9SS type A sorting domain-containing protein [Bacteroidetes bacterium]|nr:T9SS type A sorting domain-containing protein [Bacteroidota bacterium]
MKKYLIAIFLILFNFTGYKSIAQWTTIYENSEYYFMGIYFKNDTTGFMSAFDLEQYSSPTLILRTDDAGETWTEIFTVPGGNAGPYTFYFVNDSIGYGGGQDGVFYKTVDGGYNWFFAGSLLGTWDVYRCSFFDENTGIAIKQRTTDGGVSWSQMDIYTNEVYIINDSSGLAASPDGIFYTSDLGETWIQTNTQSQDDFSSISLISAEIGYAGSKTGLIFKTNDGGKNWNLVDSVPEVIDRMIFIDENRGYLHTGRYNNLRLMRTEDGGHNWDYILFGNNFANDFALAGDSNIVVPIENGFLYRTTNGGGAALFPERPKIEWYKTLQGSDLDPFVIQSSCIDTNSNLYISGKFRDTLKIEDQDPNVSAFPEMISSALIKITASGEIEYLKIFEDFENDMWIYTSACDENNNLYIWISGENEQENQLQKYTEAGELLWSVPIIAYDWNQGRKILISSENEICLSGNFENTLQIADESLTTDYNATFFAKLDQDGNLLSLDKLIDYGSYPSNNIFNIELNDNGYLVLMANAYGIYYNGDSLAFGPIHIVTFDEEFNLLWNSTGYSQGRLYDIQFMENENLVIYGKTDNDPDTLHSLHEMDVYGNLVNYIKIKGLQSGDGGNIYTNSSGIMVTGRYFDFVIIGNDSVFGFNPLETFIFNLDQNFNNSGKVHIASGSYYSRLILNSQSTFFTALNQPGNNVLFANDTIPASDAKREIIAKFSNPNTSINFYESHENHVLIYPNPTSGIINFQFPTTQQNQPIQIQCFSNQGKLVKTKTFTNADTHVSLNLSDLSPGIYYLQVRSDSKVYIEKIIIQ